MTVKKYQKSDKEKKQLGNKEAGRFDDGKVRHDLIPAWAIEELARVYTYGAEKYDDNNWWKGMKWTKVMGPLERHYNKWKRGSVIDRESGVYHLAQVAWNAIALMCYQKHQLGIDNRVPFDMDRLDPEDFKKALQHWMETVVEGKIDEFNLLKVLDLHSAEQKFIESDSK